MAKAQIGIKSIKGVMEVSRKKLLITSWRHRMTTLKQWPAAVFPVTITRPAAGQCRCEGARECGEWYKVVSVNFNEFDLSSNKVFFEFSETP